MLHKIKCKRRNDNQVDGDDKCVVVGDDGGVFVTGSGFSPTAFGSTDAGLQTTFTRYAAAALSSSERIRVVTTHAEPAAASTTLSVSTEAASQQSSSTRSALTPFAASRSACTASGTSSIPDESVVEVIW